jgi:uncharacterized membrane protein YhaH (DUF805 family)
MTSDVVELRVHGVSGTPPEDLLDCPEVTRVAGDAKAGFYIPRSPQEQHDPRVPVPGQDPDSRPLLEGYAWGGLTSGASTRAFWLLLLPFTLINVSPRLRPVGPRKPGLSLWILWLVSRLLAVSMTVLIMTALSGVGVDLFAWQCASGAGPGAKCSPASPGWVMTPLLELPVQSRMIVGAFLPLIVLFLMWKLSGRTINQYEDVNVHGLDPGTAGADMIEPNLDSAWMWRNEYQVRRLRHLHLQAGLATVLSVVLAACTQNGFLHGLRVVVIVGETLYIVAMLCIPSYTGRLKRQSYFIMNWSLWALLVVAGSLTAFGLWRWRMIDHAKTGRGGLPGYSGMALAVFLIEIGLLAAFVLTIYVIALRGRKDRDPSAPRALHDMAAAVFCLLGVFLGAVFSAGIYIFAGAWLTTGSLKPGFDQVTAVGHVFDVPQVIGDAARAYAVSVGLCVPFLLITITIFVVSWALRLRGSGPTAYSSLIGSSYATVSSSTHPDDVRRRTKVATTFWLARQVDYLQRYLAALVLTGLVVTMYFVALLMTVAIGNWPTWLSPPDCVRRWHEYTGPAGSVKACGGHGQVHSWLWEGFASARSLQGTGSYFAVLSLLLLVTLGIAAFRVPKTRRSVGILWDLASFWPRAAHPFAAPCYAERAVPDLVTRIYAHTSSLTNPKRVVLAGHSQGTVLSAATVMQFWGASHELNAQSTVLRRIGLVTFGCVLRRLYSRYFPAYFAAVPNTLILALTSHAMDGDAPAVEVDAVAGAPRWRNLWRHSDYLGGQVTVGPPVGVGDPQIEVEFIDPAWSRPEGDTRYPAASMHSDFWKDPRFAQEIGKLGATIQA